MNGIIYCRVSSKDQVEGTSLGSQELACQEYARANGIRVLRVFVEEGESAKFADRTQLLELIEFCRQNKGKIQVLLVWKIDRFARNVQDHFNVKATLMKYGISIVSVTEPIDAKPEGRLMETILAGFAQFDNDVRATRTVQGMRRKIAEGLFPWRAPLGYVSPTKGERKTKPDRPDEPTFGILQRAWRMLLTGAYTKAEIGRLLETWGLRLAPQSIDNVFGNRYYAGIIVDPWSGEEFAGLHPPMVTHNEFTQVQQILRQRTRSVPHQKLRPEFPLRGLVRCNQCWRYLTGSFSRGRSRSYPYYHCRNRRCERYGKGTPPSVIEESFKSFLGALTPKPEIVSHIGDVFGQVARERNASVDARSKRHAAELARVERQLHELIRMKTDGLLADDEFRSHRAMLVERRDAVLSAAPVSKLSPREVEEHAEELAEPLGNLMAVWEALTPAARQRFQHLLMPTGFVNGQVGTAELGLLFRLYHDFRAHESSLVPLVRKSWNQIWHDLKALSEIVEEWRQDQHTPNRPVRKDPHEYPQRDELEPKPRAA